MQKENSEHIVLLSTVLPIAMKLLCQGIAVIFIAYTAVDVVMKIWGKNPLLSIGTAFLISICLIFLLTFKDIWKERKKAESEFH